MNKIVFGSCVGMLMFLPVNVMAGFQFTAPIQQSNPQQTIQGGLLPTVLPDTPMMPSAPNVEVKAEVSNPQPITLPDIQFKDSEQMPEGTSVPTSTTTDIAVGFGNDIPLMTALRQVIPADYTYVMDNNIDAGQFVSWNGGKEWPLVINDMIEPLGLQSSIDGKIVRLSPVVVYDAPIVLTTPQLAPEIIPAQQPKPMQQLQAEPQDAASEPVALMPQNQNNISHSSEIMKLEEIEAKAIASLPTPPQKIIMQDFQTPQESVVPDVSIGQWRAQNGNSLRTVVESWANIEGVDLFWSSDFDYKLAGDVNVSGNFEQAIEVLLSGFSEAQPRPTGRLHPNLPHGPAVLVIETRQK